MEDDVLRRSKADTRIALLIDADNVSHTKVAAMLVELSRYGTANVRRAYGDWASPTLKGWKDKLHDFAIRPIQQFSYSVGKNATDMALVIDAMELLYTRTPDAFCIASSDADFTPLVMHLKANGHEVHGFGERKTPAPFVNACTTFVYLDVLTEPVVQSAVRVDPVPTTLGIRSIEAGADTADGTGSVVPESPLAGDAALATVLRTAVKASANDDGWAQMGAAGNAAKREASIDPRTYGVKNFPSLFAATGLFEIVKAANGQGYVADRGNVDRTAKPTVERTSAS